MKLKVIRDKIAWFIASKEGKKNLTEGVTDDNFYDYSYYVDLVAKSLRRLAKDRVSHALDWPATPVKTTEYSQERFDEESAILNKWADILEANIDFDNPYYKEFSDYLDDVHLSGDHLVFPDGTEAQKENAREMEAHEEAIINLKADVLAELGSHFMYMWD